MKILILINTLGAGGAERSMVEFAKFLHRNKDTSVQFVCLERRKVGLEGEVKTFGINTFFYSGNGSYRSKTAFLNQIIKRESPDIVHSVLAESNFVLRFWKLFYNSGSPRIVQSLVNTPYSAERKKDSNLSWEKFQIAKQIDKWTARLASGIFYHAITKTVHEHYKPLLKIKDNYNIIYRGRYENHYSGTPKAAKFTLINVGRQEFAKGQIDILKALVFLRQKYGIKDIFLQILGRSGHITQDFISFTKENNLENQVQVEGFVNDVERRLVKAHAFVFPSYYEGLGGSLIEAFAAKLPVVCSDIPVLKEVVGSKEGALFSAPGNHEELAENIYKIYYDSNLRNKLSEFSYFRFQDVFRLEVINEQMLGMYRDLLKK